MLAEEDTQVVEMNRLVAVDCNQAVDILRDAVARGMVVVVVCQPYFFFAFRSSIASLLQGDRE